MTVARDVSIDPGDITYLLRHWREGDRDARERLFALVYHDLKRIAMRRLANCGPVMLQSTELVNESLLGLLGHVPSARDREHFFKIAATAMRYTLIDVIRQRQADKRGGDVQHVTLSMANQQPMAGDDWLCVEEALSELEALDHRKAKMVELAFLVGLEQREIAQVMGVSLSTVERDLRFSKAWLRERLSA